MHFNLIRLRFLKYYKLETLYCYLIMFHSPIYAVRKYITKWSNWKKLTTRGSGERWRETQVAAAAIGDHSLAVPLSHVAPGAPSIRYCTINLKPPPAPPPPTWRITLLLRPRSIIIPHLYTYTPPVLLEPPLSHNTQLCRCTPNCRRPPRSILQSYFHNFAGAEAIAWSVQRFELCLTTIPLMGCFYFIF